MALVGIVKRIIKNGMHGPYAVAIADRIKGSITFSLKEDVWQEGVWPEQGSKIILCDIIEKRAGWRAMKAGFTGL